MTFEEFKIKFINWSTKDIESVNKESGYPICPYAKRARLQKKIQFIHIKQGILDEFLEFNPAEYEIGVAWLDNSAVHGIEPKLKKLRMYNQHLLYFLSTPDSGYFIKNFTNCVFIQKKKDILEKRAYLKTTEYYNNWPAWYYNEICKE